MPRDATTWFSLCLLATALGGGCGPTSTSPGSPRPQSRLARIMNEPVVVKKVDPETLPQAETDTTQFEFGFLAPNATGSHEFLIRNTGRSPLTLKEGPTSCSCTLSDVVNGEIPPGGSGRVRLEWDPKGRQGVFANSATIITNDPRRRGIEFMVRGVIRADAVAEPAALDLGVFGRGEERSLVTHVYTSAWEDFEIKEWRLEGAGLACRPVSAKPEDNPSLQATRLHGFEISTTTEAEKGLVSGTLHVLAVGTLDGQPMEKQIEIPVQGLVRVGLTISGPRWNKTGLEIGPIPQGQGFATAFVVKAFGVDTIDVAEMLVEPSWVQVRIEPVMPAGKPVGLYRVHVAIPEDAPVCDHMTPRCGELRIRFRAPKVSDLVAKLEFCILESK